MDTAATRKIDFKFFTIEGFLHIHMQVLFFSTESKLPDLHLVYDGLIIRYAVNAKIRVQPKHTMEDLCNVNRYLWTSERCQYNQNTCRMNRSLDEQSEGTNLDFRKVWSDVESDLVLLELTEYHGYTKPHILK
jgi:hypothetical protein